MYSSEDLERFYFQYQTEALPHGESLQAFCVKNKVPYNIFQKWFKDTQYYTETLNYLNRFRKEIFAYLDDGELLIDNNLAERTIRKLTTQRNNSFHYGSDAGVEMAVTYHSIISTVKLHGCSVWDFIGTFFKKSLTGAGSMLIWCLTKSLWLQANVNFKTIF